jgi:integrase/recombinase XerD
MEDFLTWLTVERGRAVNTLSAYRRDLRAYDLFLRTRGVRLGDIDEGGIVAFGTALGERGLAPSSRKRTLVTVRALHRFLADEGSLPSDPAAAVETPRPPDALPKALSEDEIEALLSTTTASDARGLRNRAILELLYGTGMRISELTALSLGDIDFADRLVRVFGKGSKERVVPVGRPAVRAVQDWLGPMGRPLLTPQRWARRGDAEALLLNARGGRLTRQGAWGVVRLHAELAGLGDRLHPHVLRHSCATHLLAHGADIRSVQELLGHASLTTTQRYTRVTQDRLRSVYDTAHPRARR